MTFVDNKLKIKKALLQGGLVIAPRGTGKTAALVDILCEDPDAVIITALSGQTKRIHELLDTKNILPYGRVFSIGSVKQQDIAGKNVYLDEVPISSFEGIPFKAATLSLPFVVKIIK